MLSKVTVSTTDKRRRDEDMTDGQPKSKREKSEDDSDGEEMEIDEDEEPAPQLKPLGTSLHEQRSHEFNHHSSQSHHSAAYTASIRKIVLHESSSRGHRRCTLCAIPTVRTHSFFIMSFSNIALRYKGFQSTHVAQSPTPNAAGASVKMAQVFFDSPELASTAKDALDGFTLKKGWKMSVAYI